MINGKKKNIECTYTPHGTRKTCITHLRLHSIGEGFATTEHLIKDNTYTKNITFAIGPAGTGKTYLAVAKAVSALQDGKVNKIILSRPAVEAGEKLGFLPGDLKEKVDPFLRPIYDALYSMLPYEQVEKKLLNNTIEIAPIAFMRGRTLEDCFIILDEFCRCLLLSIHILL